MSAAAAEARFVAASGLRLAVEEHGQGPPVVLIHGAAAGRGVWRETVAALGGEARAIAYDRRGWGASEAPEPYRGTTVGEQAEEAAAVMGALRALPAVLCGHGFGTLVALDLLVRRASVARGAVLVEPPLLSLSVGGAQAVGALREAIATGAREGGAAGAVDAYLDHVGGRGAAGLLGPDRLAGTRAAARALAADLAAEPAWAYARRALREIAAPVVVLAGARSAPVRRQAARALADLLGEGRHREADAGHLLPVEAPDAVAAAIREVLDA